MTGTLDESGAFSGTIDLGRMGTVELTATRTVDRSKKPEPEKDPEEKKEGEQDKPEKDQPDKDQEDKPGDPKQEKKEVTDKPNTDKESADAKQDAADNADKTASAEELKPPKKPKESADLEPYRALFAGKIPAFVEARDLNAMQAAAELFAKKYQLRTVILGADDLARQPDLLNDYDVSVCTGPSFSVTIDKQPATILPQLFANERLVFGFQSNGTTGSGQLPAAIQYLVSQGLSTNDALQGLTSHPAKMLSDEMNFGRIEAGKDADLVVLSGPPFEFSTKVLAVMIDGTWVYEREEDK
jgi:imidazolonepropionase-like amidohydrolase